MSKPHHYVPPTTGELCRDLDYRHRPGYYKIEGVPAERREAWDWPVLYRGQGQWDHVPDIGKFDHTANRVDKEHFDRMVAQWDREHPLPAAAWAEAEPDTRE